MLENKIICYLCKCECVGQIGEHYYAIGKDMVTKKELYRHIKDCMGKKQKVLKDRKSDTLNKRAWVKKSDKIYNRKKEKETFKKELNEL